MSVLVRYLRPPARLPIVPLTRAYAIPTHTAITPSSFGEPSNYASPPPPAKANKLRADGTFRPQLNVEVRPDHGLYKFFHRDKEGKVVTLEFSDRRTDNSGRSWAAAELRRKSFRDLHTLWYVLLRERNVLATQFEEWKHLNGMHQRFSNIGRLARRCKKSMARIKYVLNERRLAFKGARLMWERHLKREKKKELRNRAVEEPKMEEEIVEGKGEGVFVAPTTTAGGEPAGMGATTTTATATLTTPPA